MTVVIGILALIGLAVVGACGWAFAHGVRDGLTQWREAPPGGTSQPVPVSAPQLSLFAALPSSYQAGQLILGSRPGLGQRAESAAPRSRPSHASSHGPGAAGQRASSAGGSRCGRWKARHQQRWQCH